MEICWFFGLDFDESLYLECRKWQILMYDSNVTSDMEDNTTYVCK